MGVPFYTIDSLQAGLNVLNGKPQEEIKFKLGNIKGKDVYITHPYVMSNPSPPNPPRLMPRSTRLKI